MAGAQRSSARAMRTQEDLRARVDRGFVGHFFVCTQRSVSLTSLIGQRHPEDVRRM